MSSKRIEIFKKRLKLSKKSTPAIPALPQWPVRPWLDVLFWAIPKTLSKKIQNKSKQLKTKKKIFFYQKYNK
jgi:hypothetical protein